MPPKGRHQSLVPAPPNPRPRTQTRQGRPAPPGERPTRQHLHGEKAALGFRRWAPSAQRSPENPRASTPPIEVGPRRVGYSLRGIKALPDTHPWPRGARETESCRRPPLRPQGHPDARPALEQQGTHTSAPHLRRANLARTPCSSQGRREAPGPALPPRPRGPRPARGRPHPGSRARAPSPGAPGTFPRRPAGPAPHSPRARCPSSWCRGREGARRAAGAALRSRSPAIPSPLEIPAIEESPCPRRRRLLRLAAPRLGSPRRLLLPVSPQQNGPRKQQPRSPQRPPALHRESEGRGRGRGGRGGRGGAARRGRGRPDSSRTRAPRPRPRPSLPPGALRPARVARGSGRPRREVGGLPGPGTPGLPPPGFVHYYCLLAATLLLLGQPPAFERSRPLLLRVLCRGLRLLPCVEGRFGFKDNTFPWQPFTPTRVRSGWSLPLAWEPWRPEEPCSLARWEWGLGVGRCLCCTERDVEAKSDPAASSGQGRDPGARNR